MQTANEQADCQLIIIVLIVSHYCNESESIQFWYQLSFS